MHLPPMFCTKCSLRKLFLLLVVAALVANAGAQSGRRGITPLPPPPPERLSEPPIVVQPERAPTMAELGALPENIRTRQLQSIDKSRFSLGDFAGKVVVLNLWASWCGPCRNEVPEYEKVRKEYAGRAVEFIGLTTEDPRTASDRVNQFVRDFKFGFRIGWADRETALTLMNGRKAIPQTLIIAPDGHIISHWTGYSHGQGGDRLRQAIQSALSDGSPAAQKFR